MTHFIRFAGPEDSSTIMKFIHCLAEHEDRLDQVKITESQLKKALANSHICRCLLAQAYGQPAGFLLFFERFSTWEGVGIHVEDFYVDPAFRREKIGKALFSELLTIAAEQNYSRIEWWVFKDNCQPVKFYSKLGAKVQIDIDVWRLTKDKWQKLPG